MTEVECSPGASLPEPIAWRGRVGPLPALDRVGPDGVEEPTASGPEAPAGEPEPTSDRLRVPDARRRARRLVWARRCSQAVFLLLFLWLLAETAYFGTFKAGAESVRLKWPVEAFFWFDPFLALLTVLSTHKVYWALAWALVTLAVTLVIGRAFCGWVCPWGTLQHLLGWLWPSRWLRGKRRISANKPRAWQNAKYYLLVGLLGAALAFGPLEGSAWGGLFDPLSLAVRSLGLGLWPLAQSLALKSAEGLGGSDWRGLAAAVGGVQDWLGGHVWAKSQLYYQQAWLLVGIALTVLLLARRWPRFWCRALCPLGALLGVISRFSWLGMNKRHERCTNCTLCLRHCQGADSPEGGIPHRQAECHLCFNCQAVCPEDVISFGFFPDRSATEPRPDLGRRTVLASVAAGALAVPTLRIGTWPDRAYNPKVIRPPGAMEERAFLARCVRCGECMKVCPNNALQPALFEAGLEGLWTPILIPRIGYCELSCVLCGQVCPTGAIRKIDEKARAGLGRPPIKLGVAAIDRGRCLPWGTSTPCIVCEEFCPTSPKAIWVEEVEVPKRSAAYGRDGGPPAMKTVKVQRPYVDPALCVGCGACEKVCPVVDQPAIYVTSAGETRSKTNVILLAPDRSS